MSLTSRTKLRVRRQQSHFLDQAEYLQTETGSVRIISAMPERNHALVAKTYHRCCARLLMPGDSENSDAETDPQGYSAPIPTPRRKLLHGFRIYDTCAEEVMKWD